MDIETREEFQITDDKSAEWAIKKIKAAEAEYIRLMELIQAEREELNKKAEELSNHLESETGYLKSLLFKYFETVEKKETKTQQSYKLLSGSLVFKKPQIKIVKPEDEIGSQALLEYLEVNQPELIETIKKPAWGEFKKNLTITEDGVVDMATGEKLEFVQTEETAGSFDVKVV